MTIQEMHIGIDLYLQKVNSDFVDSLQPEEKDWFLNDEQKRFIMTRINEVSNDKRQGLQFNQKRYDDLENLIVPNYNDIAYIRNPISNYIDLPSNYLYLLNDRSVVDKTCVYGETTILTTRKYYIPFTLNFPKPSVITNYEFKIVIDTVTVFSTDNYPNLVTTDDTLFTLIQLVKDVLTSQGYQVYWEHFNGEFFSNQLIIILEDGDVFYIENLEDEVKIEYELFRTVLTYFQTNPLKEVETPNRLTKTEDIYEIIRGAFTKPTKQSPVSAMESNRVVVYHNGNFILGKIWIDYIRLPRMVSLSLGINSELNPNVHEELVEQVGKRLAAYLGAKNYNELSAENRNKE